LPSVNAKRIGTAPSFDRSARYARRHKAPAAAGRLDCGFIKDVEARRLGNLGALHDSIDVDQHADRHRALLCASPRNRRIGRWRILSVVGVCDSKVPSPSPAASSILIPDPFSEFRPRALMLCIVEEFRSEFDWPPRESGEGAETAGALEARVAASDSELLLRTRAWVRLMRVDVCADVAASDGSWRAALALHPSESA